MKIYSKLQKVKAEIGKVSKNSTNPFFKSKYFDVNSLLEHTEPLLEQHGLICLQPIIDGKVCTQIIDVETGDKVESSIDLPQFNDPQKAGSAITYYRRYSLQSLLALQAEDDDGNKASGKTTNGFYDKVPIEVYTSIKGAKSKSDLEKIWNNNKGIHTNKHFLEEMAKKKKELV